MAVGDEFDGAEDFLNFVLGEDFPEWEYNDIDKVGLHYDHANDEWSITLEANEYEYELQIGDHELPDWVWDDLYYLGDEYDWDWEIEY